MPRPPSPPREDPAVVKEMMRQKRLDELMETERIYLNDMLVCYHDIMPAMSQVIPLLVTMDTVIMCNHFRSVDLTLMCCLVTLVMLSRLLKSY